eukprot:349029_1
MSNIMLYYSALLESYSGVLWYQILIALMFMIITACFDEFILRQRMFFALIFVILSFSIIIWLHIVGVYGINSNGISEPLDAFEFIKIHSVYMPRVLLLLFRLGNVSKNSEYKKYENNRFIILLNKYLSKPLVLKYFYNTYYIILMINIFEAVIFEPLNGKTFDNKYNGSRFANSLTGILLIVTIPFGPFYKYKKFWYIDTNKDNKYTDFVMYLPNNKHFNYLGFGWI